MTLQHPELLLVAPVAAFLLSLALVVQWGRRSRLSNLYGPAAAPRLMPRIVQGFPTGRMLCLVTASFALGIAAAGPRRAVPEPQRPSPLLDLAVAVDVSRSMGADDVGATRVERAREVVDRLAEALPSARIVLILFADWPYTLVPPTDDPALVRYFAQSLSADLVLDRDQGSSIGTAIAHAHAALDARARPDARRAIMVLSDGGTYEDPASVAEAAAAASSAGVSVWTAGLGTAAGATLTTRSGPVLDDRGSPVLSRLDDEVLRELARAGGGEYHDVGNDRGLDALVAAMGGRDSGAREEGGGAADAAFWLTLLAIPALLVEGVWDAGRAVRLRSTVAKDA